jgi:hypothetical protein
LRGAAFIGAAFIGAAFNGAAFNGAAFNGAAFNGAAFNGAAFNGAAFIGAALNGATTVGPAVTRAATAFFAALQLLIRDFLVIDILLSFVSGLSICRGFRLLRRNFPVASDSPNSSNRRGFVGCNGFNNLQVENVSTKTDSHT